MAHHWRHAAGTTQHETRRHGIKHIAVVARRGHDDGQEHAVERHAECRHDGSWQHAASHDASRTARSPEQRRDECCGVGIGGRTVPLPCDGDAEDLVGDTEGHQHAVQPRSAGGNLLRQRRTHQHIPQVGHQTHRHDLHVGRLCRHERVHAILASRRTGKETAHESDGSRQSRLLSNDPQRESHGEIPHGDGYPVSQPLNNIIPSCHCLVNSACKITKKN